MALGDRHANGIGNPLTERASGCFDPRGVAVFRVPGGLGSKLTEVFNFFHRHVFITREVQKRIEQHRAVPCGEDETVAVRPHRVPGVEFQETRKQYGRRIGHAHGHSRMAGVRLLHRVHRKGANRVGHGFLDFWIGEPAGGGSLKGVDGGHGAPFTRCGRRFATDSVGWRKRAR